jgi:hypothetical protein
LRIAVAEPGGPAHEAKSRPIWEQLEILVAQIQRELAPDAAVTHNVKVRGRDSQQMRQVDVLVQQPIGQYQITIAIDCKDYAEPVDVKSVEEFEGLLRDIAADKGAMVAPRGFTPAAKKVAARNKIDLFSPIDTDPHKWQVKVSLPMICGYRGAAIAFGIRCSAPAPFRLEGEFFVAADVYDKDGNLLGKPFETVVNRWNNGEYPYEPGEHEDIPLFPVSPTLVDNGYGMRVPVDLYLGLRVTQELFFGHLPIVKIRGLKDEQTGAVITNAFTTGSLSAAEVEKSWQRIESVERAPTRPAAVLVGLNAWEIS